MYIKYALQNHLDRQQELLGKAIPKHFAETVGTLVHAGYDSSIITFQMKQPDTKFYLCTVIRSCCIHSHICGGKCGYGHEITI